MSQQWNGLEAIIITGLILLIALAVFLICFMAGAYNYWSAVAEVRPRLAPKFQDNQSAWLALDTFIWDSAIPRRARRQYFTAQIFSSIGMIALAVFIWTSEPLPAALVGTAIAVGSTGVTLYRWRKYRDLL